MRFRGQVEEKRLTKEGELEKEEKAQERMTSVVEAKRIVSRSRECSAGWNAPGVFLEWPQALPRKSKNHLVS